MPKQKQKTFYPRTEEERTAVQIAHNTGSLGNLNAVGLGVKPDAKGNTVIVRIGKVEKPS